MIQTFKSFFKKKKKKKEYGVFKSRSGLPIHILPLPDGINFKEDEPEELITEGE